MPHLIIFCPSEILAWVRNKEISLFLPNQKTSREEINYISVVFANFMIVFANFRRISFAFPKLSNHFREKLGILMPETAYSHWSLPKQSRAIFWLGHRYGNFLVFAQSTPPLREKTPLSDRNKGKTPLYEKKGEITAPLREQSREFLNASR